MKKEVLVVDALAAGFSIEAAASLAQMTVKEASEFASQNEVAIDLRRDEIQHSSEIMMPSKRWMYLTKAAKMGVEGYPVVTITGVRQTFNPSLAIQAVKVANEMNSPTVTSDSLSVTQVIEEMFSDLMKTNDGDDAYVWDLILKAMPDYEGAIRQIRENRERKLASGVVE
jgi:hypothetical protein